MAFSVISRLAKRQKLPPPCLTPDRTKGAKNVDNTGIRSKKKLVNVNFSFRPCMDSPRIDQVFLPRGYGAAAAVRTEGI